VLAVSGSTKGGCSDTLLPRWRYFAPVLSFFYRILGGPETRRRIIGQQRYRVMYEYSE